jgi:hypothetical protein
LAKDMLLPGPCYSQGTLMRFGLALVAEGRLDLARDALRRLLKETPSGTDETMNIEGPDLVVRAKELLCEVLNRMGGVGAEESALRAELRHEEARRGEALREVRALIRRVAGERREEDAEEDAEAVAVAPKTSNKKKNKGKRARRRRAATAAQKEQRGEEAANQAAAAAGAALPAAEKDVSAVGSTPPTVDEGLTEGEGEGAEGAEAKDDCPVCLHPLGAEGEEEEGVLIMCGHEFHVTCLDAWVSTCVRKRLDVTCPSCRAPVNRKTT